MIGLRTILPSTFFVWAEHEYIGHYIAESMWVFAIVETIHIMALAVLLGSTIIVDLRLLGIGLKRQSAEQLNHYLGPATLASLAVMFITGVPLFLSEATRMSRNNPLLFKMIFLVLAITIHFTIHRKATRPDENISPAFGKLAGGLSLFCWFAVAFCGRAIAFL